MRGLLDKIFNNKKITFFLPIIVSSLIYVLYAILKLVFISFGKMDCKFLTYISKLWFSETLSKNCKCPPLLNRQCQSPRRYDIRISINAPKTASKWIQSWLFTGVCIVIPTGHLPLQSSRQWFCKFARFQRVPNSAQ